MKQTKLNKILEAHKKWLRGEVGGVRADLREADLREADLSWANLSGADLREADLSRADLSRANLSGADLSRANLSGADLRWANLREADLREADLRWADLKWANLSRANLSGANLREANLREAKGIYLPQVCPEKGSFTAFKKAGGDTIVELLIPEDALRSSATGRKCRCSKAKVVAFTGLNGEEMPGVTSVPSNWNNSFIYTIGETVEVPHFDTNRWNECAPGIHFFITREEAVRY